MSLFDHDALRSWATRLDGASREDVVVAYEVSAADGAVVERVTFVACASGCFVDRDDQYDARDAIVVRVPLDHLDGWLAGDTGAISTITVGTMGTEPFRPIPPFDSEVIGRDPPTPRYERLDFLARLELTASPAGRTTATIELRDGRLAHIRPGEPAEPPLVKATMPMREWVRFRSGRAKIYELFANGAVVEADPTLLMFIAGLFDFDEVHQAFRTDECARVEAVAAAGAIVEECGFLEALRASLRADVP